MFIFGIFLSFVVLIKWREQVPSSESLGPKDPPISVKDRAKFINKVSSQSDLKSVQQGPDKLLRVIVMFGLYLVLLFFYFLFDRLFDWIIYFRLFRWF